MTAPDPGLTDLIAAHTRLGAAMDNKCVCSCSWIGHYVDHPAHVAFQLRPDLEAAIDRAEKAEATVARVGAVIEDLVQNIADDEKTLRSPNVSVGEAQELPAVISVQQIYLEDLRAALEGEQQ